MSTRSRFPRVTALRVALFGVCVAISLFLTFGIGDVVGIGLGAGFIVFSSMELARRWRHQDDINRSATNGSGSDQ